MSLSLIDAYLPMSYFVAYSCKGRRVCPSCNTRRMVETAVTAMAQPAPAQAMPEHPEQAGVNDNAPEAGLNPSPLPQPAQPEAVPPKRSPARYLWAVLIARIYEVFPLLCPMCGGQMRLIAFITEGAQIRKILEHIGVDSQPPRVAPARGPPLWEDCDAQMDDAVQIEPDWGDWDLAAQVAPDFADQRVNW